MNKYDEKIQALEKKYEEKKQSIKDVKDDLAKVAKPFEDTLKTLRREQNEFYLQIDKLKHDKEIYIRNQELQKNKDLFSKGMNFKDLLLTGNGKFSDYKYFLKSGTEVIPVLHLFVEGIESEDEIRKKADEILSDDEIGHLSGAYWGRFLEFNPDSTVELIRKLYQNGFRFKAYAGFHHEEEAIEVKESDETAKKRRARGSRYTYRPLTYVRDPETITVVKKEEK